MSKMTDKEIIELVEYYKETADEITIAELSFDEMSNILDLINRQQKQLDNYSHNVRNMAKDFIEQQKIIYRQQAEIEELKADKIIAERKEKDARELFKNAVIQIEQSKSEAIKEFAERLKEKAYLNDGVTGFQDVIVEVNDIDNLVDEMVGEGNG